MIWFIQFSADETRGRISAKGAGYFQDRDESHVLYSRILIIVVHISKCRLLILNDIYPCICASFSYDMAHCSMISRVNKHMWENTSNASPLSAYPLIFFCKWKYRTAWINAQCRPMPINADQNPIHDQHWSSLIGIEINYKFSKLITIDQHWESHKKHFVAIAW